MPGFLSAKYGFCSCALRVSPLCVSQPKCTQTRARALISILCAGGNAHMRPFAIVWLVFEHKNCEIYSKQIYTCVCAPNNAASYRCGLMCTPAHIHWVTFPPTLPPTIRTIEQSAPRRDRSGRFASNDLRAHCAKLSKCILILCSGAAAIRRSHCWNIHFFCHLVI